MHAVHERPPLFAPCTNVPHYLIENWVEMKNCGLKIGVILARWTY